MPVARFQITVDQGLQATGYANERALISIERAASRLPNSDRLRAATIAVGCRRGGCGFCRARVLSGSYECEPMSKAHISESDAAQGIVLACSIYPRSDLVLKPEPKRKNDSTTVEAELNERSN